MKKIYTAIGLVSTLAFASCNNELDILTDYKETMVVFGLLNPADTVQYIKINKAFLGTGNALVMGGVFDSSNYVNDELVVTMQKMQGSTAVGSPIILTKDTLIPKPTGVFPSPLQYLYRTSAPIVQDGSQYKLLIKNTRTGLEVDSKTKIVQNLVISNPTSSQTVSFVNPLPFKVKWTSSADGRLYDVNIRINYKETYVWDTTQVAFKSLNMPLGAQRSINLSGGEVMTISMEGESFYRFVGNNLSPNASVTRKFIGMDFVFTVAGEDFSTYMDVTQTGTSSFQSLPSYSNINGGVGLFSTRFTKMSTNCGLNLVSLDSLINGQYTSMLGFQ